MNERLSNLGEVTVVVDALVATSISRSEKRSLVELRKSLSPESDWSDSAIQGESRGQCLLAMASELAKHPKLLERFVDSRRRECVSYRVWQKTWLGPVTGAAFLIGGLTLLAIAVKFLGAFVLFRESGGEIEKWLSYLFIFGHQSNPDTGIVAYIDRLASVLGSLFVGVVPGLAFVASGTLVVNYLFAGPKAVDVLLYRIPIYGKRRLQNDAVRFLSGTSMLLETGETLSICIRRCGASMAAYPRYLSEKIARSIDGGKKFSEAIDNERFFPDWMIEWFSHDSDGQTLKIRLEAATSLVEAEMRCGAGIGSRFLVIVTLWCVGILTLWFYMIAILMVMSSVRALGS
jgi:hypothetical protein